MVFWVVKQCGLVEGHKDSASIFRIKMSKLIQAIMLLVCMKEVPSLNFYWNTDNPRASISGM